MNQVTQQLSEEWPLPEKYDAMVARHRRRSTEDERVSLPVLTVQAVEMEEKEDIDVLSEVPEECAEFETSGVAEGQQEEIIEEWKRIGPIGGSERLRRSTSNFQRITTTVGLDNHLICSYRPSGCVFKEMQPLLVGGGPSVAVSGKKKKQTLKKSSVQWMSLINKKNVKNLKADGPYGESCFIINLKNSKQNRKRLQTFYARQNSTNIHNISKQNKSTKSKSTEEQPTSSAVPKAPALSTLKKTRSTPTQQSECYCICRCSNWRASGAMVECEACGTWYHYKCICAENFKHNNYIGKDKHVKFICGYEICKFNEGFLMVKGKSYKLRSREDVNSDAAISVGNTTDSQIAATAVDQIDPQFESTTVDPIDQQIEASTVDQLDPLIDASTLDQIDPPIDATTVDQLDPQVDATDVDCKLENNDSDVSSLRSGEYLPSESMYDSDVCSLICHETMSDSFASDDETDSQNEENTGNVTLGQNGSESSEAVDKDSISQKADEANLSPTESELWSDDDLFSTETISEVLQTKIPENFFTHELSESEITFDFDENVWENLLQTRTKRCFKKKSWEHYFIDGLRNANPYCVFKFKYHYVSSASIRKRKSKCSLFSAEAVCKFKDCTCKASFKMYTRNLVMVSFSGNIKHDIHEIQNRDISGKPREVIKQHFKDGAKPLAVFLKKFMEIPIDQIISGNLNDLGINSRKLAQIATEARHEGRMDSFLLKSLMIQKVAMLKEVPGGFIQKIVASPLYILYWTSYGLKMYNEKARSSSLFWDATGSVVRKSDTGKAFLYYELALAHPVKGRMGIPITSMLTENQSLPVVLDWLRSFRHAEKLQFGYNKIVEYPKLLISDQSMVFILAALKEFNNETITTYMQRAWRIINGEATGEEVNKTRIRICTSHFLNNIKRHLRKKEVGLKKIQFILYMLGLLMKCENLPDLNELLFEMFIVLGSKYVSSCNTLHINKIIHKVNTFDVSSDTSTSNCYKVDNTGEMKSSDGNRFTEEDYQIMGTASPFKSLGEKTKILSEKHLVNTNIDETFAANQYHCEIFLDYFVKNVLPILPLWSSIILGDLSRFNKAYCAVYNSKSLHNTNSTVENRFRILKYICLNGRSQHRVDEFSEQLKSHTVSIQKLAVVSCLKNKSEVRSRKSRKRKASLSPERELPAKSKRVKTLIKESWNKPKSQSLNLKSKNKTGKYSKPPSSKKYTFFNTSDTCSPSYVENTANPELNHVNQLTNLGSTCWFNSVVQALYYSKLSTSMMKYTEDNNIFNVDPDSMTKAVSAVVAVWKMMHTESVNKIPVALLKDAVNKICTAIPQFALNRQQDAHEFNSVVINNMADTLLDSIEVSYRISCLECGKLQIKDVNEGQSLFLNLQKGMVNVSLQTLLDNFFVCNDTVNFNCTNCNTERQHTISKRISSFPETLTIVLGRYYCKQTGISNRVGKLHSNVHVSSTISFKNISPQDVSYTFKSAVCHTGNTSTSGHYTTIIKSNNRYVCCNDDDISYTSPDEMLKTAYIIVYDKVTAPLPICFKPVMSCMFLTDGFKKVVRDERLAELPEKKRNAIHVLSSGVMDTAVEQMFDSELSSQLHEKNPHRSMAEMLKLTLNYLFHTQGCTGDYMLNEHFCVNSLHLFSCNKCGFINTHQHHSSMIDLYPMSKNSFSGSLKVTGHVTGMNCKCGPLEKKLLFMSLPTSLVYIVDNPNKLGSLPPDLNFRNTIDLCYPLDSLRYTLKALLCVRDAVYTVVCKSGNSFIVRDTRVQFDMKSIRSYDKVVLFYNKNVAATEDMNVLRKKSINLDKMSAIQMSTPFLLSKQSSEERIVNGVRITKDFYYSLTSPNSWLSSEHINVYMHALAKTSSAKVHIVDSGWFSSRLFKKSNLQFVRWLLCDTESKSQWLEQDFIVIPVNENNNHWTLIVVDVGKKYVYYCNSYGKNANSQYICFQIWRYLCFESSFHSGIQLRSSDWSLIDYSSAPAFPLQTDGSSCGVYVCAMAHAIVFNCRLPNVPNLNSFRATMANEIAKVTIFGHSFIRRMKTCVDRCDSYTNLGLDPIKFEVTLIGIGGLCISHGDKLHSSDGRMIAADMVVLDIGSNDLCRVSCNPVNVACDIYHHALFLINSLQVKCVAICQVLPRKRIPYASYNDRVIATNVEIDKIVQNDLSRKVYYWRHRGFWHSEVNFYAYDGVHLSEDTGYPKYIRSMRDCVVRVSRWAL